MPNFRAHRHTSDPVGRLGREVWGLLLELHESGKPAFIARCQEFELTPQQAYLLKHLDPARPVPMNELASALGCDASNVTGLVDRLEARGFVERQQSSHDRRLKMIAMTKSGAEFHLKVMTRLLEPPPSFDDLSPSQLRALRDILLSAVAATEGYSQSQRA